MDGYPVYERFHSWQGEGFHLGKSAFFIRLHGGQEGKEDPGMR